MASSSLLLFSLLISLSIFTSSALRDYRPAGERKVGGRTAIENVESNQEVQDLGRFCVEQYNSRIQGGGSPLLYFSRVIAAETQVVSGIKYYLTVVARDRALGRRMAFEAVVVVRPWAGDKELLSFAPSAAGYNK